MTYPNPLPWLAYNGVELANAARTMAYIKSKRPQASGVFQMPNVFPCGVLYREVGGSAFGKPETDPAPWYHNDFPESADFLGFVPATILGLDGVVSRAITPRLGGIEGAQLGPEHQGPREVSVNGFLVATSEAGNEYGIRWLTDFLSATGCDQCRTASLNVRTSCPPEDGSNDPRGRYTLYDVGLTAGPHYTDEQPGVPATICDIRGVDFTLTAENPYLYRQPVTCLPATPLGGSHACSDICTWLFGATLDPVRCCPIAPPSLGTLGVIVTITSPDGIGGVNLHVYPTCNPNPVGPPVRTILVDNVPPSSVLVIDSARRKVLLTAPGANGQMVTSDGTGQLALSASQPLEWLEVASCDPGLCICAATAAPCSGGSLTQVSIQTQIREK